MGPLANEQQFGKVTGILEQAPGARAPWRSAAAAPTRSSAATSSSRRSSPSVDADNVAVREEIFGPVVAAMRFTRRGGGDREGQRHRVRPRRLGVDARRPARDAGRHHAARRHRLGQRVPCRRPEHARSAASRPAASAARTGSTCCTSTPRRSRCGSRRPAPRATPSRSGDDDGRRPGTRTNAGDAVDVAYQAIRRAIIEGTYPAGARLPEEELSERIGVSRTPIRQALRQLEHQGHVELRPRRGAWVSSWTAEDIAEVYGVRAQLESYGARIAAQKIGALELRHLEECCLRMEALEDARQEGYPRRARRAQQRVPRVAAARDRQPAADDVAREHRRDPADPARLPPLRRAPPLRGAASPSRDPRGPGASATGSGPRRRCACTS